MNDLNVGMVGMGVMGEANTIALLRAAQQYPELDAKPRLVVAADPVASREGTSERLGYERFTTDWHEVIEDPNVDLVCITTPNFAHRDVAVAAAHAGKPFWIEKPVGRNSEELEESWPWQMKQAPQHSSDSTTGRRRSCNTHEHSSDKEASARSDTSAPPSSPRTHPIQTARSHGAFSERWPGTASSATSCRMSSTSHNTLSGQSSRSPPLTPP